MGSDLSNAHKCSRATPGCPGELERVSPLKKDQSNQGHQLCDLQILPSLAVPISLLEAGKLFGAWCQCHLSTSRPATAAGRLLPAHSHKLSVRSSEVPQESWCVSLAVVRSPDTLHVMGKEFSVSTLQKREAVPHLRAGVLSEVMWPSVSTPFPKQEMCV